MIDEPVHRSGSSPTASGWRLSMVAMLIGLGALVWILGTLMFKGLGALESAGLHPDDAAARQRRWSAQRDLWQPVDGRRRHSDRRRRPASWRASTWPSIGQRSWLAPVTRFVNDILLSAPSIILGLFVYAIYVASVGHFSGWAGALALALIAIPVIVRATDNMLSLVPNSLREAAAALGRAPWKVIVLGHAAGGARRRHHRDSARGSPHQRRDSAAAVHVAQQPVLEQRLERAAGQSAGRDLPVRHEPVRRLEASGVGRRAADHV